MAASKQVLTEQQVDRLCETLVTLKETRSGYPIRAERLLDLAGMDTDLAPELCKSGKIKKRLQSTAKQGSKGRAAREALICLTGDLGEVAGSEALLLHALAATKGLKGRLFSTADLRLRLPKAFHPGFTKRWTASAVAQGRLPAGVGAIQGARTLHLFDLRDLIAGASSSGATAPQGQEEPVTTSLAERILKTFDRLDAESGGQNYVTLFALRGAMPEVGQEAFDEAVGQLRRDRVVSLDSADGRHERLENAVTDAGIVEEGQWLVYMKRRSR